MKANFKIPQQNIKATFVPSKNSYTASFSIPAGGGVSSDYLLLFNKPLINGVELVRDKNSLELGLASYEQGLLADSALQPNDNISELVNNVGYITGITSSDIQTALGYIPYSAENPAGFITISALNGYATENWVGQQGYLTSSDLSGYATEQWVNNQGFIKGINNTDVITALGYTPYDNSNPAGYITSESLPTVNNSTITIQKNGSDIESFNLNQPTNETINITVPTQTSDLTNNSGFITNAVNNLANYYLKSETYTKTEVQQLIASIPQFSVVVVQTLPVTGERMVLYLVPKEGTSPDVYNEYIWVETDEDYELIGNTAIDLTDYVQFTDLATVATTGDYDDLSNKPTIPTATSDLTNDSGFITSTALTPYALISSLSTVATSGSYTDLSDKPTIGNGTITFTQGGVTKGTITTNQSGDTTIDFDAGGGGGAVDSVNGQTGTVVLTASDVGALADTTTIPSKTSDLTNDSGFITDITSSDVTTALGYTPYNSTNPDGYITSSALNGYATETWVGNQGYITGITSSDVITALTYTPYNGATNPNGYITSSDLPTNYVTTDTAQDVSGRKTFLGEKAIYFKQLTTANKLGFTLYNPSNTELGALEYRPNTIGSASLLALNCPQTTGGYVGFRYWGTPAVNIVAPKPSTAGNYYITTHITDGTNTVTASNTGTVNISTLLPDVSTKQDTLVSGTNIKTINNTSILGSGNIEISSTLDIDNSTITLNSDDELQTVGIIDVNSGNTNKVWTGTQVEYNNLKEISNWTPAVENTNLGDNNWQALVYGGTKFVALGYHGHISTSTDGTDWTPAVENTNLGDNNWQALVYGGTKFVALSGGGHISTSTDGTDWTPAVENTNLGDNNWQALVYDGTKFVALGYHGHISTSTDGTTWTTAVQDINLGNNNNYDWFALAYNGTKFVALDLLGYISTSTDGTTWTTAVQDTNLGDNDWFALAYDGTKFVALGYHGHISTSKDGTTWTTAVQDINLGSFKWQSLAYDGTKFVALSELGRISIGQSSIDKHTTYVCTDTRNIYKGSTSLSANTDLSNLSTTGQNIADTTLDQNTSTRLKYWTGTRTQYDAIATKDDNTIYNVEDTTSPIVDILNTLYPIGAIYIGTMATCPLSVLGIGTWQLVAQDRVLQGAGTRGTVGSEIDESLPNITGKFLAYKWAGSSSYSGAIYQSDIVTNMAMNAGNTVGQATQNLDASRSSSTYQDNAPVQQDGYLVNIWERIS